MSNEKTTKIRIAVAIDANGDWSAFGASNCKTDKELKEGIFVDALLDKEQYCIVEAEIPSYSTPIVEGKVA